MILLSLKTSFRKYFFPFYKTNHYFLMEKWWFRLSLVAYLIVFISLVFAIFSEATSYTQNCFDNLYTFYDYGSTNFKYEQDKCLSLARETATLWLFLAPLYTLIAHYLFQLVFFKVVVNFIALGKKNNQS